MGNTQQEHLLHVGDKESRKKEMEGCGVEKQDFGGFSYEGSKENTEK